MAKNRIELKIKGMTCGGCAVAVERALTGVDGIGRVEVDLDSGAASVEMGSNEIASDKLIMAVKLIGYDAHKIS
jgi:copper chaperone CopZ